MSIAVIALLAITSLLYLPKKRRTRREQFIREFQFPKGLSYKLLDRYPHLSDQALEKIREGLRQFFLLYHQSNHQKLALPSVLANELWTAFASSQRTYADFCQKAFGHPFDLPLPLPFQDAWSMPQQQAVSNTWHWACQLEHIHPTQPKRLPVLFALDSRYLASGGHQFHIDRPPLTRRTYAHSSYVEDTDIPRVNTSDQPYHHNVSQSTDDDGLFSSMIFFGRGSSESPTLEPTADFNHTRDDICRRESAADDSTVTSNDTSDYCNTDSSGDSYNYDS